MTDRISSVFKCLKRESLRLDREHLHLKFLKSCKCAGIIPKFLKFGGRGLQQRFSSLCLAFQLRCLTAVIREKYAAIARTKKKVEENYDALKDLASQDVVEEYLRVISCYRERQELRIMATHHKKFNALLSRKEDRIDPMPCPVDYLNLSSRTFNGYEDSLLRKGPKHITPQPLRMVDVVPFFENVIKEVDPERKEEVRNKLFFEFEAARKRIPSNSLHELRTLRELRKDPSVCFLQTDKTNKLAVLDRTDYKAKMLTCISSMGCTVVNHNPLNKLVNKVRELVKFGKWPHSMKDEVKENKTGIIPLIFARLKDHKANFPLRPIVPKTQAPTYHIEKAYVALLKTMLPSSAYVVSSTVDFIRELEDFELPEDFLLASVDVIQMYPSLDIPAVKEDVVSLINASMIFAPEVKNTLISGLNLILSSNYFCFDGVIYNQPRGAPMGSPISGLLSEFVMRPIDTLANTSPPLKPAFWRRYVDDVFVIWTHGPDQFKTFCSQLDTLNSSIRFTSQLEVSGKLPFLDVLLERAGPSILRSVYRKPNASSPTIQRNAAAPHSYKIAAFSSYVTRAINICTPSLRESEFRKIKEIAVFNGFSPAAIDAIIKKRVNHPRQIKVVADQAKRIPVPYIPKFHERTKAFLRSFGVNLVAVTPPKLAGFLSMKIDSFPLLDMKGVYEVPYLDSQGREGYYIGMTSRKLGLRLREHKYDVKNAKLSTALARKSATEVLQIDFDRARIIAPFDTFFRTVVRESIIIKERQHEVCNDQASFNLPKLWFSLR